LKIVGGSLIIQGSESKTPIFQNFQAENFKKNVNKLSLSALLQHDKAEDHPPLCKQETIHSV
jgi:hypothetical protein